MRDFFASRAETAIRRILNRRALSFLVSKSCLFSLCCWGLFPVKAEAIGFYWEAGLGLNQMQSANEMFGATDAQSTGFGPTFSGTLATVLTSPDAWFPFHLGVHSRYHGNSSDTASFALLANYGLARLEFWRFMVGAGYAPFVFRKSNAGGTNSSFSQATSTGYMGQAGFILPIIPTFLLSINGTYENFGNSPTVFSVELVFRFYFGGGMFRERSPFEREYKPWRYPYGWEIDD